MSSFAYWFYTNFFCCFVFLLQWAYVNLPESATPIIDAVVMTPIALGQAQSHHKQSPQIVTMDVMEQKNWWQLEEVC